MQNFDHYITLVLIIANLIVSMIGFNNRDSLSKMIMWPYGVKRHRQYYRFITSGFIHADWIHLFFNMFTLWFFGAAVEDYYKILQYNEVGEKVYGDWVGPVAYVALYFLGLIASDIPTYLKQKDNYSYHSLGASGAVSAVVFAAVVFNPWSSIYLYGALKISALLYAVLYIFYCVYMAKQQRDNINHDAHLWGALFGLGFTLMLVAALQPWIFEVILEELKNPSLFGR